jgi:superfamily II DNA or RNA helicase
MNKQERDNAINSFRRGEIQIITSCDLIGEGLDVPAVHCIQLARPTLSKSLHLQQIGRGLRPSEKPYAIILDHVGNVNRHGFPDDEHEWSLNGSPKKTRKQIEDDIKTKTCQACYGTFLVSDFTDSCPECGVEPERKTREIKKNESVELTEAQRKQKRRKRIAEEYSCNSLQELIELGKSRGYRYPEPWARHRYKYLTTRRKY